VNKLRWFGYMERMTEKRLTKVIYIVELVGERRRSRSRIGWMEGIENILIELHVLCYFSLPGRKKEFYLYKKQCLSMYASRHVPHGVSRKDTAPLHSVSAHILRILNCTKCRLSYMLFCASYFSPHRSDLCSFRSATSSYIHSFCFIYDLSQFSSIILSICTNFVHTFL
jgi:hypothetical protein